MKKGFTLIELLAVIVILGLLIYVVSPNLTGLISDKKQDLYDNTVKEIERFARIYLTDNTDLYLKIEKEGYIDISIDLLCSEKLLKCPLNDSRDSSEIKGYVRVSYNDNKYVYAFVREQ